MSSKRETVFTTHCKTIVLPTMGIDLWLTAFGDIHWGAHNCDRDRFLGTVRQMRESPMSRYYIIMGDESDIVSRTERQVLQSHQLHETTSTSLDDHALRSNKELRDHLSFMGDRLIGMVQGNHYWVFQEANEEEGVKVGTTSTEWLCDQLKTRWLGFLSYVHLNIHFGNTTRKSHLDIVVCHGRTGGKLLGTSVNQLDDLRKIFPAADIYLMGHNHGRLLIPVSALFADIKGQDVTIKQKLQYLGRTGGFQKGYVPNEHSFAVQNLMRPAELGIVDFKIRFREKQVNGKTILMPEIRGET